MASKSTERLKPAWVKDVRLLSRFQLLATQQYQGLIDSERRRGHASRHLAKFKSMLKIIKSPVCIYSAVQTAVVTMISYKPLSGLNFARYTGQYGSYMPSSPLGVYKPLVISRKTIRSFILLIFVHLVCPHEVAHSASNRPHPSLQLITGGCG